MAAFRFGVDSFIWTEVFSEKDIWILPKPSIPLSFYLANVLPRRNAYRVNFVTEIAPDNQHSSFTAWTTRVSNPVCYPCFRASASINGQIAAFATGVLPNIYEFHLYTGYSAILSIIQDT